METTNCTYSGDWQKPLTLDSLKKAIEVAEKHKDPYQEFAESNGFDLNKDIMIIPDIYLLENKLYTRENVIFSPHIADQIIFIRDAAEQVPFKPFGFPDW